MKRILACLMLLALLLSSTATGFAAKAENELAIIDVSLTEESNLELLMQAPSATPLSISDLAVTLDPQAPQSLPVLSSMPYQSTPDGTTWLIIVDKRTLSNDANSRLKNLLTGLVGLMSPYDNAAIIPSGYTKNEIVLTEKPEALGAQITKELMTKDSKNTGFYPTVSETLSFIDSDKNVKPHVVMIPISSGENSQNTASVANIAPRISQSKISVYSIAMQGGSASKNEAALSTLSDSAVFGDHIVIAKNEKSVQSFVNQISANEDKLHSIVCSTAKLTPGFSGSLTATYAGETLLTAGYTLPESMVNLLTQNATPKVTEAPEPVATEAPVEVVAIEEEKEENSISNFIEKNLVIILIACGALLVLLIVMIVLVLLRRKPIKPEEVEVQEIAPMEGLDQFNGTIIDDTPTLRVTLSPVEGDDGEHYDCDMQQELLVGREPSPSGLVIPDSEMFKRISRTHLHLQYVDGVMYADNKSQNGTFINGARMGSQSVVIHENDRITMGRVDFIISWHRVS